MSASILGTLYKYQVKTPTLLGHKLKTKLFWF